jgi:hypothetical protein
VIPAGLLGVLVAFGCAAGFVASTVRADARCPEDEVSGLSGWPRRWLLVGVLLLLASLLLLVGAVFGQDAAGAPA